jgi:hypothetical protein
VDRLPKYHAARIVDRRLGSGQECVQDVGRRSACNECNRVCSKGLALWKNKKSRRAQNELYEVNESLIGYPAVMGHVEI